MNEESDFLLPLAIATSGMCIFLGLLCWRSMTALSVLCDRQLDLLEDMLDDDDWDDTDDEDEEDPDDGPWGGIELDEPCGVCDECQKTAAAPWN